MSRLSSKYVQTLSPAAWTSLAANVIEGLTVPVDGVQLGDMVFVTIESSDANEHTLSARATNTDEVRVFVHPDAGGGGVPVDTPINLWIVSKGTM